MLREYALPNSPIFVFVVGNTPEQCLELANEKMVEENHPEIVFTDENLLLDLLVKKQEPEVVEYIEVR